MDAGKSCPAFAEAAIRSVELIVQPDANDGVGEMGVRRDLAPGRRADNAWTCRDTRNDASGVEVTEVHVKALDFVGPTGN